MTRYTNFARPKRTFLEAGFDHQEPQAGPSEDPSPEAPTEPDAKKRKRVRSKKTKITDSGAHDGAAEGDDVNGKDERDSERPSKKARFGDKPQKKDGQKFDKRQPKDANARKFASERRRLKRVDDRHSDTICFACRERGHTARDCTNTLAADTLDGEQVRSGVKAGRDAVGICYRCGSRRHTLSRCREPVDSTNPLPFASCFVCSGKGHLASMCPKNQSKGIYPNGGCCKLCKETTHLAKDCPLRKQGAQIEAGYRHLDTDELPWGTTEVAATTLFVGTGQESGADEDDFHTFKRKNAEVDHSEKAEEKAKRKAGFKVGAHSGVVFGDRQAPKKKKVVFF